MAARTHRYRRSTVWGRRLLAVLALAAVGVIAWRLVEDALGPDTAGASVEHLTIESKAVGRSLPVDVVLPPGDDRNQQWPMLVFLHGRDGDEDSEQVDQLFAALAKLGDRAPIVAFPYGGDHSYWHNRADAQWANYVVDEVIPQVAHRYDGDRDRVAIAGISMGGFGAFDLALHRPGRFCAVGGHSPALWQTGAETAPGAFDDAEDFARHDVIANAAKLDGLPVWLDAGDEDPFRPGDEAFAAAVPHATVHTWPGGHDGDYWNAHWRDYLRFYARAC
jgi:S-formylglutathione hydrolase FrmB